MNNQLADDFSTFGICSLPSFIAIKKIATARNRLYDDLKRLGYLENGKWQTKKFEGISPFQVSNKIAQKLSLHPEYDQLIPDNVIHTLCRLSGQKLNFQKTAAQLLVTPPQKELWTIPTMGWHVDVSTRTTLPGIQIFILLDDLPHQGGATLAIKGSHLDRNLKPSAENVLEMSGRAGDVFLMDMRVIHAPSTNALRKPRLMMTTRFIAAGVESVK